MIQKFLQDEKVNNISVKTLAQHEAVLNVAAKFKPLSKKWTKADVNKYIILMAESYKQSSIEKHKQILKKFFLWADNAEAVQHLKVKNIKNNLRREDILSVEDVNKLIETTDSPFYKALIAFMFESGARISEILAIKVKDITETDKGMVVSVPSTKTANGSIVYRRDLYPFSGQYIRNHISYAALHSDDVIFNLWPEAVHNYLQRLKKKAGISKPCNPHAFRHGRATDLVLRGYSESIIRKKLGWTGDSSMIARYVTLADDDVINATAEKAGNNLTRQSVVNIKEAEPLRIADASLQLAKLADDNTALQDRINDLENALSQQANEVAAYQNDLDRKYQDMESRLLSVLAKHEITL